MIHVSISRAIAPAAVALSALLGVPAASANPFLLYEPATDMALDHEDLDRYWHPASLTKMMTAYVTLDAIKAGRLAAAQKLELSAYARSQPATRIGLRSGIDVTVEQGIRGLIMRSANDFAVALAEAVSGSEPEFVALMNTTARRLGMLRTHFKNPHGLPDPEQVTSARDMAALANALLRDFPDFADVFSAQQMGIGKATLLTLNDLLRTLPGADGMKTGFTCSSGYNIVASATRNGRRLIVVLLGEVSSLERSQRAAALINAAFEGKAIGNGEVAPVKPQRLAEIPLPPMKAVPAEDLTHHTRTWKCGNPGGPPRPRVAQAVPKRKAKQ